MNRNEAEKMADEYDSLRQDVDFAIGSQPLEDRDKAMAAWHEAREKLIQALCADKMVKDGLSREFYAPVRRGENKYGEAEDYVDWKEEAPCLALAEFEARQQEEYNQRHPIQRIAKFRAVEILEAKEISNG